MVKSWALEPDAWDQVLAPTLTTYETLGKSFNLSMPQFPHLLSGVTVPTSWSCGE